MERAVGLPGDSHSAPQPIAFGKYTLLERISHGGMAEVFRARTLGEAGFERIVAIKLLLPQVASDGEFVTMLIDEAKIAGQLSHANIAQIFDLGQIDGRYFIVQEYVPGKDLRAILKHMAEQGERLSLAQSCHLLLKVCEGLDYAHNKRDAAGKALNLVHRDISPQNVIVSNEGEVKLIDFGIVKAEGRATRTLAGLVKGKFAYMSPEQIRGLPVDRRSDVFACGILLHELLTGRPLFRRPTEFETLKRARSGQIDPPSAQNPLVPEGLDRVVLKALTRHVDDRYQSAIELRDALWGFVRQAGCFYSRAELAGWMRDTFGGDTTSPEETAPLDSMPASLVEPADAADLADPVDPAPRARATGAGRPADGGDGDFEEDSEGDVENMTLVDPELPGRVGRGRAIDSDGEDGAGDGNGDDDAGDDDAGDDDAGDEMARVTRPSQPRVQDLAMTAMKEPRRAVFSAGGEPRLAAGSDPSLNLDRVNDARWRSGGDADDDETTSARSERPVPRRRAAEPRDSGIDGDGAPTIERTPRKGARDPAGPPQQQRGGGARESDVPPPARAAADAPTLMPGPDGAPLPGRRALPGVAPMPAAGEGGGPPSQTPPPGPHGFGPPNQTPPPGPHGFGPPNQTPPPGPHGFGPPNQTPPPGQPPPPGYAAGPPPGYDPSTPQPWPGGPAAAPPMMGPYAEEPAAHPRFSRGSLILIGAAVLALITAGVISAILAVTGP